jgi:hypothetical protein
MRNTYHHGCAHFGWTAAGASARMQASLWVLSCRRCQP